MNFPQAKALAEHFVSQNFPDKQRWFEPIWEAVSASIDSLPINTAADLPTLLAADDGISDPTVAKITRITSVFCAAEKRILQLSASEEAEIPEIFRALCSKAHITELEDGILALVTRAFGSTNWQALFVKMGLSIDEIRLMQASLHVASLKLMMQRTGQTKDAVNAMLKRICKKIDPSGRQRRNSGAISRSLFIREWIHNKLPSATAYLEFSLERIG